jgi:outer membrane protein assembly factor BamB
MASYRLKISVGLALLFGLGAIFFADEECAGSERDWQQFQYNAQHAGCNPAAQVQFPMQLRWVNFYEKGIQINQITVVDGKAIVTYWYTDKSEPIWFRRGILRCLDAGTGQEIWSHDYRDIHSLNQATSSYGYVYLQISNNFGSRLIAYDLLTGAQVWSSPFESQWEYFLPPTIYDSLVLIEGGFYGGMYVFDAITGQEQWAVSLCQWERWTPAAYRDTAFSYTCGYLTLRDIHTDRALVRLSTLPSGSPGELEDVSGYVMGSAPVIDSSAGIAYCMWQASFGAIDYRNGQLLWRWLGDFDYRTEGTTPAMYDHCAYALDTGRLVVYDGYTGAILWQAAGYDNYNDPLCYPPVIASGHVFVSDSRAVYAFNIETHAMDWKTTPGGVVSIAGDMMYVGTSNGAVYACGSASTAVEDGRSGEGLPLTYELKQSYPNPFNATTVIGFDLPRNSHVRIDLYNTLGQRVKTLIDAKLPAGSQAVEWDGTDAHKMPVASGTYLCRFTTEDVVQTKKVTLLK